MKSNLRYVCTALAAGLTLSAAAKAEIVTAYNSFGTDFGYSTSTSRGMGSVFGPAQHAMSFTAVEGGALSDVYLGLFTIFGGSNITIRLATNDGFAGPTSANVLEQWTLASLPGSAGAPVTHLVSQLNPVLDAGENYWLWITVGSGAANWGQGGLISQESYRTRGSDAAAWSGLSTARASALRVDVVPAPGAAALLGLGAIAFGVRRRR